MNIDIGLSSNMISDKLMEDIVEYSYKIYTTKRNAPETSDCNHMKLIPKHERLIEI